MAMISKVENIIRKDTVDRREQGCQEPMIQILSVVKLRQVIT
jgi:hypothetical protein